MQRLEVCFAMSAYSTRHGLQAKRQFGLQSLHLFYFATHQPEAPRKPANEHSHGQWSTLQERCAPPADQNKLCLDVIYRFCGSDVVLLVLRQLLHQVVSLDGKLTMCK